MRAVLVQHAEFSVAVAEDHQVFAHQARLDRRAVPLGDFFRKTDRQPVATHDAAHRRGTLDAAEKLVLFPGQHFAAKYTARAMRTIGIGVAGLGRAFSLMAPTFAADKRVSLVAAADPRAEARRQFESEFRGRAYATVAELCAETRGDEDCGEYRKAFH